MAKAGMRRPKQNKPEIDSAVTSHQPEKEEMPVPEIQGKAKSGNSKAK